MDAVTGTPESKILQAAQRVFVRDGFDGARMQDIADEAGINKALLHYYFRSKDKLFSIIFDQQLNKFLEGMRTVLTSDSSLQEKIRQMVAFDIIQLIKEPIIPLFIFHELSRNPDLLRQKLSSKGVNELFETFSRQVENEISQVSIQSVDPKQLFVNMLALSMFPFMAKPMLQEFMTMDNRAFEDFMQERKQQVADVLIQTLAP